MSQRATTPPGAALILMTYRVEMVVFLAVVAFTYLSISRPFSDGNQASRIGLTFSIVERGELNIDRLVAARATEDWARHGGHFYSNKAPGPALLAVPLYFVQNRIQRAMGVADDNSRARWVATYLANVATSIVPTLLALPLLWTVLMRRVRCSPGWAFALCGTWAVGSMALPYSVMFFGHQSAGAFFAIGACLTVLELESDRGPRPRVIALAGLAMGLAVSSDFLAGALVGVWTVYLAWRTRLAPRLLAAWAVGGAGPLAVIMAYDAVCFGSPFTTAYNLSMLNPRFVPIAGWEWPSLDRLLDITVRPWRGMFYATPVFALTVVGLARLRGDARGRPEVIGAAAGVVLYFGLLAAFPSSFGGYCIGPRYFTPALPLALLLVAGAARTMPRLFGALLLASTLLMFVATLTEPLPDEQFKDPFRDVLFPMLAHDGPSAMRNLFTSFLRFSLVGALLAYLAIWAGLATWLRFRLRRREALTQSGTVSLAGLDARPPAPALGALPVAPSVSPESRVAIFIVAYNAVTTLTKVLDRIPDEVWRTVEDVYVFDDASKDDTALLGRAYQRERGRDKLHIHRHEKNQGYGGNQKLGYQYAVDRGFDFVVLLHGDGQYAPEVLPQILAPLLEGRADAVLGSRMMSRFAALKGGMPLYKYLGNKVLSTYQNVMMNSRLSEFHSGYRAYSVAALERLPFALNSNDFHFDTEIIIQLMAHGFRIKEVPIPTYYGDEICYVNGMKYAKDVFRTTLDYRLHRAGFKNIPRYFVASDHRYPSKVVDPLSSHSRIAARVQAGATVLDVGAGSGALGEALKARGARITGIDLARPPGAAAIYDRFIEQDVDHEMILPEELRFDVAIFGDVLEHVREPRVLLEAARARLEPGGRIIASTGNIALWYYRLSLLFGRFNYRPRGILDETHVKLYTLDTFRALVESAGLRVTGVDVTPIPLIGIHPAFGRAPLSWLHRIGHLAARTWKRMFAYQFILEAEPFELK